MIRLTKLICGNAIASPEYWGSRWTGAVSTASRCGAPMAPCTFNSPFSVSLSLDPLTNDPELVGREIRNHLDAVGIRERHCVVGLPLKWALTTHLEVPELPEADVASFLQIEAERGFPLRRPDPACRQLPRSTRRPANSTPPWWAFRGIT